MVHTLSSHRSSLLYSAVSMGNSSQVLRWSHSPCQQLWHQFCWPLPMCCLRTKEYPIKLSLSHSPTLVLVGLLSTMAPLQRLDLAILSPQRTESSKHCCFATDISSEPKLHSWPGCARHFLLLSLLFLIIPSLVISCCFHYYSSYYLI